MFFLYEYMQGPSKTRKLKGIKEKHIWSLQIMNKLVDHAKKHESAMNQTSSSRRSAYGYFRRGQGNTYINFVSYKQTCTATKTIYGVINFGIIFKLMIPYDLNFIKVTHHIKIFNWEC